MLHYANLFFFILYSILKLLTYHFSTTNHRWIINAETGSVFWPILYDENQVQAYNRPIYTVFTYFAQKSVNQNIGKRASARIVFLVQHQKEMHGSSQNRDDDRQSTTLAAHAVPSTDRPTDRPIGSRWGHSTPGFSRLPSATGRETGEELRCRRRLWPV